MVINTEIKCGICNLDFQTSAKLRAHKYDTHVNKLQAVFADETFLVERVDGKYGCPRCTSKLATPTTFSRHIKLHGGDSISEIYTPQKRANEPLADEVESSIIMKQRKINESSIIYEEASTAASPSTPDERTATLMAFDGLSLPSGEQEKLLMLAKIGDLKPVNLTMGTNRNFCFLTSDRNVEEVIVNQPAGSWSLPLTADTQAAKNTTSFNDGLLNHILTTGPLNRHLTPKKFVELTKQLTSFLNKDWRINPQMRYATSSLFAGAVLLEGSNAILLNCVEPYGRSQMTDAHYERKIPSSMHLSSYPEQDSLYGAIKIIISDEDNVKKLKIGLTSCNLLVTSSVTLNRNSLAANIVELGPNTTNFTPSQNTRVFIDEDSIKEATSIFDDKVACCINEQNPLFQLKQVRSKFYCKSTYPMCRSFGSTASNLAFRPYTIWTLCEYDSTHQNMSQARKLSFVFQTIALAVIENGADARIGVDVFQDAKSSTKGDGKVNEAITAIVDLAENGFISIINNTDLSTRLQTLADSLSSTIQNANSTAKQMLLNQYKS